LNDKCERKTKKEEEDDENKTENEGNTRLGKNLTKH